MPTPLATLEAAVLAVLLFASPALAQTQTAAPAPSNPAREVAGVAVEGGPRAVRHDVARAGEPILTLRHFRIQKGSFPEFLELSQQGVWPFFEKIGSRVVGMWQVIHPRAEGAASATEESEDFDEVWLLTRYASVEHWQASRRMAELGGNGPDYQKAVAALARRRELTLRTDLRFLSGEPWSNPPFYLPPVE